AIVYGLLQKLGGKVYVKSEPGKGSTFTLVLPRRIYDYHTSLPFEMEDKEWEEIPEREAKESGLNQILLIEDNEQCIAQIKYLLEEEGFQVEAVRGGEQALSSVKEKIPNGIILDLMMPGVDGFEVLRKLREDERTRAVPVLILTAKDLTEEEIAQLRYNKIQQLVFKGAVNKKELVEKIKKMLKNGLGKSKSKEKSLKNIGNERNESTDERGVAAGNIKKFNEKALILIAEDNPDNLLTMKAILKDHYKIITAVNGEEVLQKVYAEEPALILLDIGLPKIDGFQILEKLKQDPKTKLIPIIAVTARGMSEEIEKILGQGCDDYILKPINVSNLTEKIRYWLAKR
ncbi:MAG TPA: response regulator, partial [Atribacterota bacterium]|nr:response regulator [Atribacterota bacterium]